MERNMEHEMNFFDLCVAFGRAIGRGCKALGHLFSHMLRLTCRYWWVVITIVVLALAAALYYTRKDNLTYKVNAVALLNGPSIQQFEQAYAPLCSGQMLPPEAPITKLWKERKVKNFRTFRVVDCMHDGVADFIDYRRKSSPTDTLKVQMDDRLCLQFRIKQRDIALLPEIEREIMLFLNLNGPMQQSFIGYRHNLEAEVAFNHSQAHKLDSLTSQYYFHMPSMEQPNVHVASGVNFYGNREVKLFLKEIYDHQKHMQRADYRLQLATAPVVLENHFAVDSKPVNGRLKCVVLFLLLGWIVGCAIAEIVDKRKALSAWLKA